MSSHFSSVSLMTDLSKTMKREGLRIKALISHKTVLVSGRFTFRFMERVAGSSARFPRSVNGRTSFLCVHPSFLFD